MTRRQREATGDLHVGRAVYQGRWCVEPRAWEPLTDHLFNVSGKKLQITDLPLETIGKSDVALVHLSGVHPVEFSTAQLGALQAFAQSGGTVLIETLGGRGEFSTQIQQQLGEVLGAVALPLTAETPIISGAGIEAASDCRRVVYRWYSVAQFSPGNQPQLMAYWIDGRPAIVLSHEDLSLGALGLRRWEVHGYATRSARELLSNLLLAAGKSREEAAARSGGF